MRLIKVSEVKVGDMLDLEGDPHADPGRDNIMLEHELATVLEIDHEGTGCTVLYCDGISCGFPPDHMVKLYFRDTGATSD